jgi:hypothetical protein
MIQLELTRQERRGLEQQLKGVPFPRRRPVLGASALTCHSTLTPPSRDQAPAGPLPRTQGVARLHFRTVLYRLGRFTSP